MFRNYLLQYQFLLIYAINFYKKKKKIYIRRVHLIKLNCIELIG